MASPQYAVGAPALLVLALLPLIGVAALGTREISVAAAMPRHVSPLPCPDAGFVEVRASL